MTTGNPYPQLLARLVDEALSIEVAKLDHADPAEVRERVVPDFVQSLEEAISALSRLESDLEADAEETPALVNLCCVVRGELEHRLAAFSRLSDRSDLWSHLETLEWAQHELIRGLCAVESHLARALGTPAATGHVDLLEESLAVRELVAAFRHDLGTVSDGESGLARTLEAASESLVRLTERTGFGRLRALDRRMARELHRRIVDWLRHPTPQRKDGTHLWEEVRNFSVLLHDISRRSELVSHDMAVLDEVIDLLAGVNPQEPPPGRVLRRLQQLSGLDDELDSLLRARAKSRGIEGRVRHLYERLRSRWSIDAARDPLREVAVRA